MTPTRPIVLVTEPEYRKGEDCFTAAPGLDCRRTSDGEQELAAAVRDAQVKYIIVGNRQYTGPLYDALPAVMKGLPWATSVAVLDADDDGLLDLVFQAPHRRRQWWLRHVQACSIAMEVQFFGHRHELAEQAQIDHFIAGRGRPA